MTWTYGWRVEDSTPLKRFKRNRSGYLTRFQKGTSKDASKHGRNAGTSVFVQKGSTLKVMEEFNIQGKQNSFYKYCPGTFGYTLVWALGSIGLNSWLLATSDRAVTWSEYPPHNPLMTTRRSTCQTAHSTHTAFMYSSVLLFSHNSLTVLSLQCGTCALSVQQKLNFYTRRRWT